MASTSPLFGERLDGRSVVSLSGAAGEQEEFLQSLVTNDVGRAAPDAMVYAALLTPQGKYLADFLVWRDAERNFHLDVATPLAADLVKRLTMYRLRRPVQLAMRETGVTVLWGLGAEPGRGLRDPRHPDLGWRVYDDDGPEGVEPGEYDLHRLRLGIPEGSVDLVVNETYLLEAGFERLHGVDFRKGCYVGQEIVARMKFKTELRKGLRRVAVEGKAPAGTPLYAPDGKLAGALLSNRGGYGLAHLRFDRAGGALRDGDGAVEVMLADG